MKEVKFLVNTAYQGPRHEGETLTVPDDFANRWSKNKIAEIIGEGSESKDDKTIIEEVSNESEGTGEITETPDYESMSGKALYELCKEKGLEVEAKQSKAYYIEKLS